MESSDSIRNRYVISISNYEGGLLGISLPSDNKNLSEAVKELKTEYAFTASDVSTLH